MAEIPAAAGHVSIPVPSAAAAGGEVPPPTAKAAAAADDYPEKQLARFVRCIVLGEWMGNGVGTLALAWATAVLLGGFCSSLNSQDFWFAMIMIFIESISQYLFGSARALRWNTSSSFPRMLVRPQEGNHLVLIVGLWFDLIHNIPFLGSILVFIIVWSWQPQHGPQQEWHIRALAIAYLYLSFAAYKVIRSVVFLTLLPQEEGYSSKSEEILSILLIYTLPAIIEAGAVLLLLNLRRLRGLANLIATTPWGRRLISLAKVISALWLAAKQLVIMWYRPLQDSHSQIYLACLNLNKPITMLVLSLGSLQSHAAADSSRFGRCTDAILHIFFLFDLVEPIPVIVFHVLVPGLSDHTAKGVSWVVVLVVLLIGNLQIPTAVVQIVLSSMRLRKLLGHNHIDYSPQLRDSSNNPKNIVPAIVVFYLLALCQGSLYIMASLLSLVSAFPRRWLMRRSKIGRNLLGAKAIDLYYHHAYMSRMEMGVFGTRSMIMGFADFAIVSLLNSSTDFAMVSLLNSSSSPRERDMQVAGLYLLHKILVDRRTDSSTQDLILRVTSGSSIAVSSTMIGMLAWASDVEKDGCDIRLLAARVIAELACSLRISSIPGMLKPVSSLLELAENADRPVVMVMADQRQQGRHLCQFWQRMKEKYWSIPEEPTLISHQDSPRVLGMEILEKLATDIDNCVGIFKDDTTNLISKTIGLIGLVVTSDNEQNDTVLLRSSLEFLRRLATTGERIGTELRDELWSNRNGSPQLWEPAMDIIAKLALDKEAGLEIGKIQVITARLLDAFFGKYDDNNNGQRPTNMSLRKVSGEALANLALWGTANCSTIMLEAAEPGCQVVFNDLKNMLSDDEHGYVAASLLLCHPHASEHLSSALTIVMEHMMAAEGKQLESLINLASEIADVTREAFIRELDSQANIGAQLVEKLVRTLNSKKIPNPEYPRMRRVIIKMVISILECCPRTVEKLMEQEGMMMERLMESLTKIERAPSRVEDYRVFYGNIGVVPEEGEPMSALVARAKALLVHRTTQTRTR